MSTEAPQRTYNITKDNATQLQRLAHEKMQENKRKQAERIAWLEASAKDNRAEYQTETLARVRQQMDRLFDSLEGEEDPAKMDKLTSALARLEVIEQKLSMRSAPAAVKQAAPKQPRHDHGSDPVE